MMIINRNSEINKEINKKKIRHMSQSNNSGGTLVLKGAKRGVLGWNNGGKLKGFV